MSWLEATADLLEVARAILREQVMPGLDADRRYTAVMVANALAIAARELDQGGRARAEEQALLAEFLGQSAATLPELRRRLCRELRDGAVLADRPDELRTLFRKVVHARLTISNPDARNANAPPARHTGQLHRRASAAYAVAKKACPTVPSSEPDAAACEKVAPCSIARNTAMGPDVSGSPTSQPPVACPNRRLTSVATRMSVGVVKSLKRRMTKAGGGGDRKGRRGRTPSAAERD